MVPSAQNVLPCAAHQTNSQLLFKTLLPLRQVEVALELCIVNHASSVLLHTMARATGHTVQWQLTHLSASLSELSSGHGVYQCLYAYQTCPKAFPGSTTHCPWMFLQKAKYNHLSKEKPMLPPKPLTQPWTLTHYYYTGTKLDPPLISVFCTHILPPSWNCIFPEGRHLLLNTHTQRFVYPIHSTPWTHTL